MSRIGKLPVPLPKGVEVTIEGRDVTVKGPKGTLGYRLPEGVQAKVENGSVVLTRASDHRRHRSFHGLARALVSNMVTGVSQGFVRELEIVGIGYRAETKDGRTLTFHMGYSHPVVFPLPEGVTAEVGNRGVRVKLMGIDKQVLGQVAANIRAIRPPEPYKGKGIRYVGEEVRRKVGKAGAA